MSPALLARRGFAALAPFVVLALVALPGSAQKLGTKKNKAPTPAAPPPARAEPPAQAERSRPLAPGLRGTASSVEENEGSDSDPAFDPKALAKRGKALPSDATAAALHLAQHPKRDELAKWLVDSVRGREIDVALLGGQKYMINDCLGIKASAGTFKLKLENPVLRFDGSGIVLTFEIDKVSMSALRIRMRPNPNVLELCRFSKKFEVGSMDDVRLTLRLDPLYQLERCRIASLGDLNPEVRIGNLNLKPLQNDLDRMAKNMVEDSLTFALQVQCDGMLSMIGDLLISAMDQFLEADCPTRPGDTDRAIEDLTRGIGGLGGRASGGGGSSRGTEGGASGGSNAGSSRGSSGGAGAPASSGSSAPVDPAPPPAGGAEQQVAPLLARIEALEARISELEAGGPAATDVAGLLQQLLAMSAELERGEAASPLVRDLLAQVLGAVLQRSGESDARAWLGQLAQGIDGVAARPAGAGSAPPAGAANLAPWYLVQNPALTGRMGRIVVHFPDAELSKDTLVAVHRDGKKVADRYGEAVWEFLPGVHEVKVTNVPVVGCEVRSGCDTLVRVGLLQVELSGDTLFAVYRKGQKEKLCDRYGSATIGFPIGEYEVEIQSQRELVAIRDGEVTRF